MFSSCAEMNLVISNFEDLPVEIRDSKRIVRLYVL
jgi:deoxycytidine triphosphate deaminase